VRPYLLNLAAYDAYAMPQLAAVQLDLSFTGSAACANAANLTFEVRPGARQAWQLVLELCHLDLELGLAGTGPLSKDLDDQARPVGNGTLELLLEVSLLDGAELIVDHDQVVVQLGAELLHLFYLAAAEVRCGIRAIAALNNFANGNATRRIGQAGQFFQRVLSVPGFASAPDQSGQERASRRLRGAGVVQ
jgi:hypothetical protein